MLRSIMQYDGEKKVLEFLVDGPRGTGKTLGFGWGFRTLADAYPGIRMIFVRKTRTSITQSFCPDFENIVLASAPEVRAGPTAAHRQEYRWRNGSILALAGLVDDPGKIYSTNWDLICFEEAWQFTARHIDDAYAALRQWTRGMRCQVVIELTNPRQPSHQLLKRWRAGRSIRYRSFHKDNPKWWNGKDWTPEGKAYMAALAALPDILRRRNYLGEWCSAEGAVWECYDEEKHLIDAPPKPPLWHAGGMDWGHTEPCALLIGGKDEDGTITVPREVYFQKKPIVWWGTEVLAARRDFQAKALVVDPSRPEIIEYFNQRVREENPGMSVPWAMGATNTRATSPGGDLAGLDLVRHYLETGKLFFLRDRLRHGPDPELVERDEPTCVTDEIPDYVNWRPRGHEEDMSESRDRTDPMCVDHGCDALRYLVQFMHTHNMGPLKEPPKPKYDPEQLALMKAMGIG